MYEEFFGLTEKPFSIQPDPSFLYWGRSHRLAYAMLEYGVLNRAGISVITGEVGCGKTTLIHRLLDNLSETHTVALLSNIQPGRGELLSWVLMGFGKPFAGKTHVELFAELQNFFIAEYAKGRRVVLIIDEAQNLAVDMLEELRMLSNINAGKDQLLQLILVGQPQLKDLLNRPDMLQLAQRVGSDFHLTPLNREEVAAYLETRLSIAGAKRRIFTERAIDLIAEQSRGVPRVINIIADTALVYAFSAQDQEVDSETIAAVIRDKSDYGVFGLASDAAIPAPKERATIGPDAFVAREDAVARDPEEAPVLRAVPREPDQDAYAAEPLRVVAGAGSSRSASFAPDDLPRMPTPKRARTAPPADASSLRVDAAPHVVRPISSVETAPAPTASPPQSEHAATSSAKAPPVVGIIITGNATSAMFRSLEDAGRAVFVAPSGGGAAAKDAGVSVVEISDRSLSPGRARNAGYRQLKKLHPDLAYAQFIEPGTEIEPEWLDTAARFLERRPEVAAVDGPLTENFARKSFFNAVATPLNAEPGEIQHTGAGALLRASAFESAGGFRGDLPVNEMQDLCIRLRRRGAHIWRLDQAMAARQSDRVSLGGWWARARECGYIYAHGAALHGAPPERLYAAPQLRAIFWGAVFPLFILAAAVLAGVLPMLFAPTVNPFFAAGATLLFGMCVYLLRVCVIAIRNGAFKGGSWSCAALIAFGHIPEFFGVLHYFRGKPAPRSTH
jgi:type II secretory pathway predicted ATPase ExeA